jgi:hypothetical protein
MKITGLFLYFSKEKHKPISKGHVDAIGTASIFLLKRDCHRNLMENRFSSKLFFPGWIVLRFLPAKPVLLYSDIIQTVLETSVFSIQIY